MSLDDELSAAQAEWEAAYKLYRTELEQLHGESRVDAEMKMRVEAAEINLTRAADARNDVRMKLHEANRPKVAT